MADFPVVIHLDNLLYDLQLSLQRAVDLVAVGMHAALTMSEPASGEDGTRLLPGAVVRLSLAPTMDFEMAREEFRRWVIENGFRDATEALGPLLEAARKMLRAAAQGPRVDGDYFQTYVLDEESDFDRRTFLAKLKLLEELGGPTFMPEVTRHVTSVNQARNCLVPRRGVVGHRDVNCSDGLLVEWVHLGFWITDADGHRELVALQDGTLVGGESRGGGQVSAGWGPTSRLFRVGDRLSFSAQDFADLCWTFLLFGKQLRKNVEDFVQAKGIPVQVATQ